MLIFKCESMFKNFLQSILYILYLQWKTFCNLKSKCVTAFRRCFSSEMNTIVFLVFFKSPKEQLTEVYSVSPKKVPSIEIILLL
jgi:hypothetical protein